MKEKVIDIPCFVDEKFLKKCQGRSLRYLKESYGYLITEDHKSGCIQLLVPFSIRNPYGPDLGYEKSLKVQIDITICNAAIAGHLKVKKALVPLVDKLKTPFCYHNYCGNYPQYIPLPHPWLNRINLQSPPLRLAGAFN